MEGGENDDEDVPRLPRRDERMPPPWFERAEGAAPSEPNEAGPLLRLSWPRTLGLLALVLLIIGIPLDFEITYYGASNALGRTPMTLGFVWAVVIEGLAIWGLTRLVQRR